MSTSEHEVRGRVRTATLGANVERRPATHEALRDPSAPSLFEPNPRERRLQWMLDRVRDRYGARALLWGECGGPYTGAKIAYQSFPDLDRLRWLGVVDEPMARCPAHRLEGPAGP